MPEQFQIASPPRAPAAADRAADPTAEVPAPPRPSAPRVFLRALRPKQWAKNILVLAAPGAAGVLTEGSTPARIALAFVAFCLVSSATYLVNDIGDVEADRRHPTKRNRPIAAGLISVRSGWIAAALLMVAGLAIAASVRLELMGIVALYVVMTLSYTFWLKHEPILDIAVVASGFIVRAVAGGVAVDVPISRWFLIVTSFGSLFIVAGKRHAEHLDLGPDPQTRATLAEYSAAYLRYVYSVASGVCMLGYCLWAFEQSAGETGPWFELSIVPFVLFILRYALLIEEGHGEAPEELVLGDRTLLVFGAIWAVIYAIGVSLAH